MQKSYIIIIHKLQYDSCVVYNAVSTNTTVAAIWINVNLTATLSVN